MLAPRQWHSPSSDRRSGLIFFEVPVWLKENLHLLFLTSPGRSMSLRKS